MDTTPGKLCLVANELNYLVKCGGIGTSNWLLAHLLARHGWQVHVLYCGPGGNPLQTAEVLRQLEDAGIRFTALTDLGIAGVLRVPVGRPWECIDLSEQVYHALRGLHQRHGFDLVQFADWGGLGFRAIQAKAAGLAFGDVATIVKLHGTSEWVREGNGQWPGVEDLLLDFSERYVFEGADYQISPSHYMLDYVSRRGWRARADAPVVCHPIDSPRFPRRAQEEAGPPELVFFGRLEARKGLEVFLDALKDLDRRTSVTFLGRDTVLGNGRSASSWIQERLDGRAVRLLMDCDREQALRYLAAGNRLAIIPTLAETFCHAVAECAVHGVPFLASRVGGIPELLPDSEVQANVLFEPRPRDLLRCLESYLRSDLPRRRRWREKAFEGLDPEHRNLEIVRFYNETLRKARDAREAVPLSPRTLEQPLVTVAVTHYNLGAYLPEALASLAAQTYPNLEVLVLDDGSTDVASVRAFEEQERRYPSFRFLRHANAGLCRTRNRALAEAKGNFFLPFDADDVAMPHMVQSLVTGLLRAPQFSAVTCFLLTFRESQDLAEGKFLGAYRPTGGPFLLGSLLNVYGGAPGLFRTGDLRAVGGYDAHPANQNEDRHTYLKMVTRGYQVGVVPEHLFYYRIREGSLARTQNRFQSLQHILQLFGGPTGLSAADTQVLLRLVIGLHQRREPSSPEAGPLRYRVADKLNCLAKKIPGVHGICKAVAVHGSNLSGRLRRALSPRKRAS
jgi:glycosyltransferase involved in cell wall biosynthesis/GT2 family glycosyltransferase